jgi:hypothetical protein
MTQPTCKVSNNTQGNSLIRQKTLPIPDSNVSETSVMVLPQDYVAVQWPVVQFTYDASTFEIGTFCHYAPQLGDAA